VARVPGEAGDPSSAANPGGGRRLNPHAVERPIGPEHGTAPPPRGSIINIVV
jgi:hypothetical protein